MSLQTIHLEGKPYVVVERDVYDRLTMLSKAAELPALPAPDEYGNYPAVEYARASIARGIIRDRVAVGWTQAELARRAGIRVETLCRIETGKHTPALSTIHKIDRALQRAGEKLDSKPPIKRKGNRSK